MPPKKKKVVGLIKLHIKAGEANPAPPVGPALGQHGVNIMEFCKAYNAATDSQRGNVIPVEISVYEDRSFTFALKTPPAARLLLKAAGVAKGSAEPHVTKVAKVSWAQVREAEDAGADVVGAEELAQRIQDGFDDFDVAIATPDLMPIVGRLGRILGPAGKMPNPKVGTVTMDVGKAVEEAKAGKVEYRTDRTAIVHLVIGKRDFDDRRLLENYAAVMDELIRAKPSAAKGRYIRSVTFASSMGPGVKVDPSRVRDIVEEPVAA